MTDQDVRLIKKLGSTSYSILQFIRKYPRYNTNVQISEQLNIGVRTVGNSINYMKLLNILSTDKTLVSSWDRKFVVNERKEWKC